MTQHNALDSIEDWKANEPDDTQEFPCLDFERGTLRRVMDPEGRAPEGAAIFIGAIVMWLVILAGASIWAAGLFP